MVDNLFKEFEKILETKAKNILEKDSMGWFVNQVTKIAKLTRLQLEELAETFQGSSTTIPPTQPTDVESITVGGKQIQMSKQSILGQTNDINQLNIGQMILYNYDPKWKQKLPYYDTFPLVIPITYIDGQRFRGLNMHYLPPYERAELMTTLLNLINTKELNEKTRLKVTYNILNNSTIFRSFRPCFKEYLTGHIRSSIMVINPNEWSSAIMLPIAQWQKESQWRVYKDSIKLIYK